MWFVCAQAVKSKNLQQRCRRVLEVNTVRTVYRSTATVVDEQWHMLAYAGRALLYLWKLNHENLGADRP